MASLGRRLLPMFILAATAIFIATGVSYAARDEGDPFASDP